MRAYKTIEGGKYYSAETQSDNNGVFLPKYTQLNISLAVNGVDCAQDEHGVFHAYVGGSNQHYMLTAQLHNCGCHRHLQGHADGYQCRNQRE